MFISIRAFKTPINTAKEGEVIWSEGIGNVLLKTRNNAGEIVPLLLKNVLYVPTATCSLISVLALRADGHQTIYPEPENGGVCRAGIIMAEKGLSLQIRRLHWFYQETCLMFRFFMNISCLAQTDRKTCGSNGRSVLAMLPFPRFAPWRKLAMA